MFRGLLRPGQGFRRYTVLRRENGITATGRPITRNLSQRGTFLGMISRASQAEQEQWKQRGHPISHTVLQRGTENRARPEDVLELESTDGAAARRFLVQGVHDPAELGHFTAYQVLEREDFEDDPLF